MDAPRQISWAAYHTLCEALTYQVVQRVLTPTNYETVSDIMIAIRYLSRVYT